MLPTSDRDYFPRDYAYSRKTFISSIEALNCTKEIGQWPIPGKKDNDLYVDYVWLPPTETPEILFVLTSGIHGSETYAGAAVQAMFINEILPTIDRRHIGIFIVHAMNPYGFKNHQRCTEAGVNLNRNFSVSGENYKKKSEASFKMCERFLERKAVDSLKSSLLKKMRTQSGTAFFDEVSLDELVKATSPGQFERVQDWEFGGHGPEPQTELFIQKISELMHGFQKIVAFDLHTGLGDRNRLHLLMDEPGKSLDADLFSELIRPHEDEEFYTFTPPEADGFYPVHGAMNSAFGDLSSAQQRVCALTMEFGTLGHSLEAQLEGLNSFALAHQGHFHGYADTEIAKKIIQDNFERSRPLDPQWELAVIKAARGLFLKVLGRLN